MREPITVTVTLQVYQAGREAVPKEYDTDEYAVSFAVRSLLDRLMVEDKRPFVENAISHLAVSAIRAEFGDWSYGQPALEGQVEADSAKTMGFTSEAIAAARERNSGAVDNPAPAP